uniref:Uncharacterized protein n=1 Tax=Sipha flava TaxID=143950 RepID=A0A2S2PXI6_9HEMI
MFFSSTFHTHGSSYVLTKTVETSTRFANTILRFASSEEVFTYTFPLKKLVKILLILYCISASIFFKNLIKKKKIIDDDTNSKNIKLQNNSLILYNFFKRHHNNCDNNYWIRRKLECHV